MEKKMRMLIVLILAAAMTASVAQAQDITSDLVGHWPFEAGSGITAFDSSGNGNHGTLMAGIAAGLPEWKTTVDDVRICAGAIAFDDGNAGTGEGNYVDCGTGGDDLVFNITDNVTFALWVKIDAFTRYWQFLFSKGRAFTLQRYGTTSFLQACVDLPGDWAVQSNTVVIDDGLWHHIAVTYDSSTGAKSIYIDGTLNASRVSSSGGPIAINNKPLCIGILPTIQSGTNAIIDDVRIYNRTLSADDILALWAWDPDCNLSPQVDAGSYQSLLWPDNTAQLDATVSDDGKPADPCMVTLTWSKLSGPGNVTFPNGNDIEDPLATFDAVGFYELQLSATDGEKDACDVVTIRVRADDDPIAYWDFEEGVDSSVGDCSVNNNVGTFGDPEPNWVDGWIDGATNDKALEFYGNGSRVEIAADGTTDPNLDNLTYEITVASWVNVAATDNGWAGIVTKGDSAWRLAMRARDRKFHFAIAASVGVNGEIEVPLGEWHHVAGVFDGSELRLYVDGVLDVTLAYSGEIASTDYPVWLGSNSEAAAAFEGKIDDTRVYCYAMSETQIQELVDMGRGLAPIVDAGEDETFLMQGGSLQLDGTVTDDGKPVAATLEWTADPCNGVVFSDTSIEDPTVTFAETGTYVLRLTADDTLATVYDEVTIIVENPTCADVTDDGLLLSADISGSEGVPDCHVDIYDFAAFAGNWLRCNDPQDAECEFPF